MMAAFSIFFVCSSASLSFATIQPPAHTDSKVRVRDLDRQSMRRTGQSRLQTNTKRTANATPGPGVVRATGKEQRRRLRRYYIQRYIEEAAAKYHLEPALLRAVIWAESAFDHKAVSRVGARGLMQLMPATARSLDAEEALDCTKPRKNIMAGARYLRKQINTFQGNLKLALAAYNAGPHKVRKYKGIPPYRETQNYVKKIMKRIKVERRRFLR